MEGRNTTGAPGQQNRIMGEEKEDAESVVQEVEKATTPSDPPPTLPQILTQIQNLTRAVLTPAIAMEIASTIEMAPYLPEAMKTEIKEKADAYRSACEAYESDRQAYESALEDDTISLDADTSTIDAEGSALESDRIALESYRTDLAADRTVLEADRTALDAERPALEADKPDLDAERSALAAERSALEADRTPLEAVIEEGVQAVESASEEIRCAVRALLAKDNALSTKERAYYAKQNVYFAKQGAYFAKQKAHSDKQKAHSDKQKAYYSKQKAYSAKQKAYSNKKKASSDKQHVCSDKKKADYSAKRHALDAKKDTLGATEIAFVQLNGFQSQIMRIMGSIRNVEYTLHQCAARPKAEATITMSEGTFLAANEFILANLGENPDLAGNRPYVKGLYKGRTTLDHKQFMNSDIEELTPGRCQLKKVSELWSSWILNCKISADNSSNDTKKEIATVVKQMREALKNLNDSPQESVELHPILNSSLQEVTSSQPFFVVLLDLIDDCCEVITGTNNRRRKRADGCLDNAGRFLFAKMDTSLTMFCELKPLFRKLVPLQDLHYEIFEQTVGPLSQVVYHGLKLWGSGAQTWATGMTVTLAYITVYRLDLKMSEYSEFAPTVAKLQLAESVKLPLMTLDCFNEWIQKDEARQKCDSSTSESAKRHKKEIKELRDELYEKNGGLDDDGVPIGIRLICDLMLQPRSELFGPNYQEMIRSGENKIVGELLGTGSFGHVFSLEEEADAVLKVSVLHNSIHLEKELEILRFLGREQSTNRIINEELALPVVTKFLDNITVELGGAVKRELKGLVFRPKGQPIRSFLSGVRKVEGAKKFERRLVHVSSQLKAALNFLHEKCVCHNDVAPKNIIVRSIDEAGWHVCLVDFGCASSPGELKTGFVGTPHYAHKTIFDCYPSQTWEPIREHDFFSLGLTMGALLTEGEPCWDMTPFPASLTDAYRVQVCDAVKKRNEQATAKIRKSTCSKKQKGEWLSWITPKVLLHSSLHEGPVAPAADSSHDPPPVEETETEHSWNLRMNLRSGTKRKEMATIDHNSTGPSPKK